MSDNESEDNESDYEEERTSMGRGVTVQEWLTDQCQQFESTIKSLQREIRVLKSNDRKTKSQLRIDYNWDGDEANLSDKVPNWVNT